MQICIEIVMNTKCLLVESTTMAFGFSLAPVRTGFKRISPQYADSAASRVREVKQST